MYTVDPKILFEEKEKWSKGITVKKGKMKSLLGIKPDEKVSSKYTSGEKLAKALMAKVKDEKEVTGMLAYAANLSSKEDVFDSALSYMKKIKPEK